MPQLKIETDFNGQTHLTRYTNEGSTEIISGTVKECKDKLIDIIKSRNTISLMSYDESTGEIVNYTNTDDSIKTGVEFLIDSGVIIPDESSVKSDASAILSTTGDV